MFDVFVWVLCVYLGIMFFGVIAYISERKLKMKRARKMMRKRGKLNA